MAANGQTSINIPQLLAVAVVGFLALRWWMSKPPSPTSSSRQSAIDPAKINQISTMFPQLDRRHIAWDLSRNGGNVEATTERVLAGRGLDVPPVTYRPNLPDTNPTNTSGNPVGRKNEAGKMDLITKYGLQGKVGGKGKAAVESEEQMQQKKKGEWSSDKSARAEMLKRRREEMILKARRKMEMEATGASES